MKRHSWILAAGIAVLAPLSASADVTLYGPTGPTPALITAAPSNWFYAETPGGANIPITAGGTGTVINSLAATVASPGTAINAMGGFSAANSFFPFTNALLPALNESQGYTLHFSTAITAETHADRNVIGDPTDDDRAGFSVIAISSDLQGIELSFFTDRIFTQNTNFVGRGEQVAVNTIPMTSYDLSISNGLYTLSSGATQLLSGSLRNYSGFGLPYSIPSFLFMGDDTTSAGATAEIGAVTLSTVPEPCTLSAFGLAGAGLLLRRGKNPR